MADPLLTTLCAICHAQPPKYTCPACQTHTCSLPCTQRHKAWSSCTGRRDPTTFRPLHMLKTPAGIDHDYNFLTAIERTRERNQRVLIEEKRGLFSDAQLGRDLDGERRWRREWFGEEVRFVSKDSGGGNGGQRGGIMRSDGEDDDDDDGNNVGQGGDRKASTLARRVRARLDAAAIEVVRMPVGMARQRDNTTAWNRRAARINWCVEWIIYDDVLSAATTSPPSPLRIRHKALETRPLYRALGDSLAWHARGKQRDEQHDDSDDDAAASTPYARKRRRVLIKELKEDARRSTPQEPTTGTFQPTPYPTQNPYTGAWDLDRGAADVTSWRGDEEMARRRGWRFYLLKPLTPAGKAHELIPCSSGDETLGAALRGRTVLEFPTVYVLPPASASAQVGGGGDDEHAFLPPGFVLASTDRRTPAKRPKRKAAEVHGHAPNKRQRGGGASNRSTNNIQTNRGGGDRRAMAHRPRNGEVVEEGEIDSGGEEKTVKQKVTRPVVSRSLPADAADTTSSDPDTSSGDDDGSDDDDDKQEEESAATAMNLDDVKSGWAVTAASRRIVPASEGRRAPQGSTGPPGLVDYGSSADEDEDEDEGAEEEEEEEGEVTSADLANLKPEDPELVASAIQEIVGLLT